MHSIKHRQGGWGDLPQNDGFSERWSVTRDNFTPPDVPENLLFHQGCGEECPYGSWPGEKDIKVRAQ